MTHNNEKPIISMLETTYNNIVTFIYNRLDELCRDKLIDPSKKAAIIKEVKQMLHKTDAAYSEVSTQTEHCSHNNIKVITEIPTGKVNGETVFEAHKRYVVCADCGEPLEIYRIEQQRIHVPLTKTPS